MSPAEHWTVAAIIVAVTGLIAGLIIWAGMTGRLDCPKGQSYQFAYYETVMVGNPPVPDLIPIDTCQADR